MMKRGTFLGLVCVVVLANYAAQIPYGLHLYGFAAMMRHSLPLLLTLLWFVVGFVLTVRRSPGGYWVLLSFLSAEFAFYLFNTLAGVAHGYGVFPHLWDPDHVLAVVFAVGYLNFVAGAFFLAHLIMRGREFRALTGRRLRELG